MVIASLAKPEVSPDAQLLSDSGKPTLPFQDTIYFRQDLSVQVCGSALERIGSKSRLASAIVFVQHRGIIQIIAQPPPADDDEDMGRHKVTAKSKLYQATFFSSIPDNIIDFSVKSRHTFALAEIEQGAYSVSSAILSSSIDQFEKVPASMDDHLSRRASALRTLMSILRTDYPPLGIKSTWRLLWHAEKLAAASELWKWYQGKLHDKEAHPEAYPEALLMNDIIKALADRYKTKINPALGETDPVRQFFLKDVNSLEVVIPWAWQYLRLFYLKDESKARAATMQRLSEGNDVVIYALETAFKFRAANVEFYGLDPSILQDGVLLPGHGYDILPHFWTSTHNLVSSIRSLTDVGRNQAIESFDQGLQEDLAQKIALDNPRLVKLGCQTHIERFRWALEQSDEQKIEMGKALKEDFDKNVRPEHIYCLVHIGMASEGMNLAEMYDDMPTLVRLIWDETTFLEENKDSTPSKMERAEIQVKLERIRERIRQNFDVYGEAWASAFYSQYINENQSGQMLMQEQLNQPSLSKFLRADPARARLQWINEVCGEKNYQRAAEALYTSAKQESNAWCQKVELSIGKLALLCKDQAQPDQAEQPKIQHQNELGERLLKRVTELLEYTKIQDRVYERLLPTVSGSIDDDAAIKLLMTEFGQGRLTDRPAQQSLLEQGFRDLLGNRVLDPALLIDVLTLMTYDETAPPVEIIQSNEFAFALKVLALSWPDIHKTTRAGLLKLVWKRLCIKDNWAEINNTKNVSDAQLQEFLAHTTTGWTWKAFQKMLEDNPSNKVVSPPSRVADLIGAGATHGELCIRFASEDIRNPIIADNLADDAILKLNIEKYRLEGWFQAACKAGKIAYEQEKNPDYVQALVGDNHSASGDASEPASAVINAAVQGKQSQDVEMQDQ